MESRDDKYQMEAVLGLMDLSRREGNSSDVYKYLDRAQRLHFKTGKSFQDYFEDS